MNKIPPQRETGVYQLLDLEVDLNQESVSRAGEFIALPELSFRLLAALIRWAPATINKDELVRAVWDEVVVSDETLSQRVRLLRQALGEDAQQPRYISSVRGRGYRLICSVIPVAVPAGEPVPGKRWSAWAAVLAVLAAASWLLTSGPEESAAVPSIRSIAVLPFADLSPHQDHRYFADGMQDELLTRLSKLESLKVASRTSVEQYRSTVMSLPEIAQALGVGAIIESSVRVSEDRVRITVQLIDAQTDRHLWAEVYDRALSVENIFTIQREVAEQVGQALALEYQGNGATTSVLLPTTSLAAYDAYLLGRAYADALTPQELALGIEFLQEAVAIDPEFADAWVELGWAYSFVGTTYGGQPPREVYPRAREAVTRALSINHELAKAHSLYADILAWYDWDFAAAEREYLKTMTLTPDVDLGYVLLLSTQLRQEEALALMEQSIADYPEDDWVHINAGWTYRRAHLYKQALREARLAPGHSNARSLLGFAYLGLGELEQAIAEFETDLRLQDRRPPQLSNLAAAYFEAGRVSEARQLLNELIAAAASHYVSPDLIADVYFAAGDVDNGFAYMQQAVETRSRGVIFLQTNTSLDDHRQDPRYLALIQAVGF